VADRKHDANRDPITKEPGSHPVGTAGGSAAGAAAGAAIGSVAGPVGTLAGGVIGAVAGGAAGHAAGEKVNPTVEETYWRENYTSRPYVTGNYSYDDYAPAYRAGWESRAQNAERRFDEVESDLGRNWDTMKGKSRLKWEEAKQAARDAWDRIDGEDDGPRDRR
jgi:phage tail tape-measure protein